MYTGIVQELAEVTRIEDREGFRRIDVAISSKRRAGLELGASVGINGVCLTVAALEAHSVGFDVIPETLSRTNLDELAVAQRVNVERSAKIGDENGGHDVSGHVDTTARIIAIDRAEGRYAPRFEFDAHYSPYLFDKGFVALDGASLTVCDLDRDEARFSVNLIPETLERTRFGTLGIGARVNLEVERRTQAIVDTVRALVREQPQLFRADST